MLITNAGHSHAHVKGRQTFLQRNYRILPSVAAASFGGSERAMTSRSTCSFVYHRFKVANLKISFQFLNSVSYASFIGRISTYNSTLSGTRTKCNFFTQFSTLYKNRLIVQHYCECLAPLTLKLISVLLDTIELVFSRVVPFGC